MPRPRSTLFPYTTLFRSSLLLPSLLIMFIPSTFKRPVSSWKALNLRKTLLMASSVRLKALNCSHLTYVHEQQDRERERDRDQARLGEHAVERGVGGLRGADAPHLVDVEAGMALLRLGYRVVDLVDVERGFF